MTGSGCQKNIHAKNQQNMPRSLQKSVMNVIKKENRFHQVSHFTDL